MGVLPRLGGRVALGLTDAEPERGQVGDQARRREIRGSACGSCAWTGSCGQVIAIAAPARAQGERAGGQRRCR